MTTFLIPFKGLVGAKTRWGMQAEERQTVLQNLLEHNLSTVAQVVGASSTVLVCPDASVFSRFPRYTSYLCPGNGLNSDLESARSALAPQGAMAVLLPDLPELSSQDIEAMIESASRADVTLCPDRAKVGTNGLALAPGVRFPFLFEGASFQRHLQAARDRGYRVEALERPGLAYDADFASDLFPQLHRTEDLTR